MDSALMFFKSAAWGSGEKSDRVKTGPKTQKRGVRARALARVVNRIATVDRPIRPAIHVLGAAKLLPHQHERIGAGGNALPGRGIALGKAPGAAVAAQQQPVGVEPPGRKTEPGDRGIASGLHRDLVAFPAGGSVRQREL